MDAAVDLATAPTGLARRRRDVVLIEPSATVNTGDTPSALTAARRVPRDD